MFWRAAIAERERSADSHICKKFIIEKNRTSMSDPASLTISTTGVPDIDIWFHRFTLLRVSETG
jgi:hypothetical protein